MSDRPPAGPLIGLLVAPPAGPPADLLVAPRVGPLTRELLLTGDLADIVARANPGVRVLTAEERATSLAAILAARPDPSRDLWVFAYGSLIWNPLLEIAEERMAVATGWHRAFCLNARSGRGTPENPGLMLGLRPGLRCHGAILRIAEADIAHELDLLWRREMVADGYIPRWVPVEDAEGDPIGHAIAFTINPDGPAYTGDLPEPETIRRPATASGSLGSAAEYLFNTRDGLRRMGISDPFVERLGALVEAEMARAG